MTATPLKNSRLVLRVAIKGIEEYCSYLEIDAWMPSEVKAILAAGGLAHATDPRIALRPIRQPPNPSPWGSPLVSLNQRDC